jgi:Rps23 Pro-64 3,4-dihydroxylase Tpa1-like proline 4-hydroxylase
MSSDPLPQTPVVIFDEFLVAQELRELLEFTLTREPCFAHTEVIGGNGEGRRDLDYRRSRVLFDLEGFDRVFSERLKTFMPRILTGLGIGPFDVSQIEIQLTGTNNSEFFRMHTDNDAPPVARRLITFVYFFHREPRAFSGGELRIHDSYRSADRTLASGPYRIVYPQQNQIVFFYSGTLHEILPVGCPTGQFADSRFTVNGWFHQ